jgi:hypothetical protein
MCTKFEMFTEELFLGFETICSTCTFTGIWYGQEKLEYPAQTVSSLVQADKHPPEPHCTEHNES